MKNITVKPKLFIATAIAVIVVGLGLHLVTISNKETLLRNRFEQKIDERKAFFDKMYKIITQKSQVSVKNDSSFRKNVEIIMEGRKDAEGTFMKWIQESNPNTDYKEVAALYKDLSRSIEAEREGFFTQEKVLQDVVREHKDLIRTFPTNIFITVLGRQELNYNPISSDFTDTVFKTGKENDINLF